MLLFIFIISIPINNPEIKIAGYVRDKETGLPLPYASVFIEETIYGVSTDENGYYSIKSVPQSKYMLRACMIGFNSESKQIDVRVDKTVRMDFYLTPSPINMEEILVTAKPPDYIVITRDDIEKANKEDISDILASIPGVFIKNAGNTKYVSIRGSDPNKVLILIDGVVVGGAGRTFDISSIPKDFVERIEVIKGGSIVYQTEAIGGVINIMTDRGRKNTKFRVSFGSFDSQSYTISYNPFLSIKYSKTGDFIYVDKSGDYNKRNNSSSSSQSLLINIPHTDKNFSGSLKLLYYDRDNRLPGAIEQQTPDAVSNETSFLFQADISLLFITSKTYISGDIFNYKDLSSWSMINTNYNNTNYGQILKGEHRLAQNTLSYGCSYTRILSNKKDRLRPLYNLINERKRSSLWLNNAFKFGSNIRGIVTCGMRYDMVENFKPIITPRLGIALSRGEGCIVGLYGNWGKTYRVPSFHELFWVPDIFAMGNPDLVPEKGTNSDVGLNISIPFFGMLTSDITFFYTDIRDIIIWRRTLYDRYTPQNVSRARIYGREERLSWENNYICFEINHTYLNALNLDKEYYGKRLIYRPEHTINVKAGIRFAPGYSNIEWRWVDRRAIREANTKWLSPYNVVDLNAGLNVDIIGKAGELKIEITNLTNKSYEIIERYPMPERSWAISIAITI